MRVVGIDSAEVSGLAVIDRDESGGLRLVHHRTSRVRTAGDVDRISDELATYQPTVIAVEEPFVSFGNPSVGLVLARLCGRWLQALETRGQTTVTIPASLWQTRILPGVTTRTKSAERKAAAVLYAHERFAVDVGEDAADAIAMAAYVATNASRRAA